MADYIFIRKSRNILSTITHILLNFLLAAGTISATVITGSVLIGLILLFVAKWRIFAVNHRYWLLNIRSSLVDLIVGISLVLLAYAAGDTFTIVHFGLIALYAIWLIIIKPLSTPFANEIQSLTAVLLGITTASIFSAITGSPILVIAAFIIGFGAAHHVLIQTEEKEPIFISLIFGLLFAEIAWIAYSWLIIYTIGNTGVAISQIAIILTVITYTFFTIYHEMLTHKGKIKFANIAVPVAFCLLIIITLLIGFTPSPLNNTH